MLIMLNTTMILNPFIIILIRLRSASAIRKSFHVPVQIRLSDILFIYVYI